MKNYLLVFVIIIFSSPRLIGQNSTDSAAYIIDYSDKLLLRIYTITKSNSLIITNTTTGKSLVLEPNGQTNIGLGFNYKRFGLGLAFGFPKSAESNKKYGKTKRIDIQGSIYGDKIGGDGFFQLYEGYYNSNPNDFINWNNESFPQNPTMRILSLGISSFYLFNSEKYSYRAAFVRDGIQKSSAGSFLLGVFANFDEAKTDNGFIPQEFPDSTRIKIDLKEFASLAFGVTIGYAHNFIIEENLIIGFAIVPGFGYQRIDIVHLNDETGVEDQAAGQLLTRLAIGYEFNKLYLGFTGSVNFRNLDFTPYDFELATQQFRFIIGKRFF
jgi:hypothetical protein